MATDEIQFYVEIAKVSCSDDGYDYDRSIYLKKYFFGTCEFYYIIVFFL